MTPPDSPFIHFFDGFQSKNGVDLLNNPISVAIVSAVAVKIAPINAIVINSDSIIVLDKPSNAAIPPFEITFVYDLIVVFSFVMLLILLLLFLKLVVATPKI